MAAEKQGIERELEKLRRESTAARKNVKRWRHRALRLEGSTSYRLGRAIVNALKSPRGLLHFPREMWGLLRSRGGVDPILVFDFPSLEERLGYAGMAEHIKSSLSGYDPKAISSAFCEAAVEFREYGANSIAFTAAREAVDVHESSKSFRCLFLAADTMGDIEEAARAVAGYESSLGQHATPEQLQNLRRMKSSPSNQLHLKKLVGEREQRRTGQVEGRICYVLHNSLPYSTGGYATRAQGIAAAMSRQGYEVVCLTRPGYPIDTVDIEDDSVRLEDVIDDIQYIRTPHPQRGVMPLRDYMLRAADEMESKLASAQPMCVIAASNYLNALPALIAARRLGIPFLYEVRGFWEVTRASREPSYKTSSGYRVQEAMEAFVAQCAEHTLTLTEGMRLELISRGVPRADITLLPNCCDPAALVQSYQSADLQSVRAELDIPMDVPVIGYVGTFVDYEGLEDLAKACGQLKSRGVEFRLLLVGSENTSGSELGIIAAAVLEEASSSGYSDWLLMPGRVPHEEVPKYYGAIDIAVFPRKPWPVCEMVSPMKPLEALCLEKAVVASDVLALAEMIRENETGLLYEKGNVDALANTLDQMAKEPELRARLGAAGSKWVSENRTWDIIADTLSAVVSRVSASP